MDWFERLTGFRELTYAGTRAKLYVRGSELRSRVNGASYGVGELEVVSLAELRERVGVQRGSARRLRFSNVVGEVGRLHQAAEYAGALFQVASQFNMLEMVGPGVTPEEGVTRYASDPTQGPACAVSAGAATIFRNYFARVDRQVGQTATRQLNGLAEVGQALAEALDRPVGRLWTMSNGYALCTPDGLAAIGDRLLALDGGGRDRLRALLRIGVHRDVEVTSGPLPGQRVSQAFCSALPVAYAGLPKASWGPFASLVLEAAYEATLLEGVLNARRGVSDIVLLTRVGGGVFGNDDAWIDAAILRALTLAQAYDLDVRLVSNRSVTPALRQLERRWTQQP